jgi:hypothetical protein
MVVTKQFIQNNMDIENAQPSPPPKVVVIPPIQAFQIGVFRGPVSRACQYYCANVGFYFGVLLFIAYGTFAIVPAGPYKERNTTHAIWFYSMAIMMGAAFSPFFSLLGNFCGCGLDFVYEECFN